MGIREFFGLAKTELKTEIIKPITDVKAFSYQQDVSEPVDNVIKTSKGYLYGINGLFPQELNYLYNKSPLHAAVLNFKKLLTSGNGYLIVGDSALTGSDRVGLNQLTNQFDKMMQEVTMDLFIHSRVCIKVLWNKDNTKIIKLERISPEKIHINDLNDEMCPTSFLYNWDWQQYNKFPTKKYYRYDKQDKENKCQLFFYQVTSPGMKLYSEPSYISALNWVVLDSSMSDYHKANISNSINPSVLIQYYEKPGTREEKQQVLYDLNQSFAGARKAGRAFVTFSDGKELAPTVTQMEPNKLDKTFLSLTDTIQRQVLYAHNINPALLGLKTAGSLGSSTEVQDGYKLFNATVIQPSQLELECIYNTFLSANDFSVKLKLKEPTLFDVVPEVPKP